MREPLFGNVQFRHDLDAADERVLHLERSVHKRLQHAVDPEPNPVLLFVRLHMNIACASLERFHQEVVNQLDDGSIFRRRRELAIAQLFGVLFQLKGFAILIGEVHDFIDEPLRLFALGSPVVFFDGLEYGLFRGDHRLNVEAGHELDVVQCEYVGRIHHRHGQRRAHAAQRQNLILRRRFLRNQLDHSGIDIEKAQVDGRDTVLAGKDRGNFLIGNETEIDKNFPQAASPLRLFIQGLV